ncbi:MAG: PKD domain-containing protein [Bacteroidota bacterium]
MRKFYLILLSLCSVFAFGQNQINGYTYWYNSDYAGKITQTIVPQQQADLQFLANTDGLPQGLNVFHFQAFDINGICSSPVSKFFYKTQGSLSDTNRIAAYRSWFNNDLNNIDTVFITAIKQTDIIAEIDANAINDGLNSINFQVMDEQEIWSSALSRYFLKSNTHFINAYQYWFNNDIASAVTVDVFPAKIVLIDDPIDASGLNEGMNIFHLRFRDEQNLWSSTISQFFFKTSTGISDTAKVCAYQYWFDNDFVNAVTENIISQPQPLISASVPADMLTDGLHVFNVRFKEENGLWSSAICSHFFKPPVCNSANNLITEYQYWFNTDFTNAVQYILSQPIPQHELLLNIDMTQMPKGNYLFNLRTKDTLGLWSSVTTDAFTKNPFPISSFTANITEFCDSGYVQFTNNSIDGDVYLWDFGDATFSNDFEPQHFFAAAGQYTVSLTVTDIATMSDSTISMLITAHPSYHFFEEVHICNGGDYIWHGQTLNQQGLYYDSLLTAFGCDSIFTLQLWIEPHYLFTADAEICHGEIYAWRGNNYSTTGSYYDSLFTQYGCDSIYVLNLTVHPVYEFTVDEEICNGDTFTWHGDTYSIQDTYYDSLFTQYGCDSIYILNLTVHPVYEFTVNEEICNGEIYTWQGDNYSTTGSYNDSLTTQYGCDSVYVLNLTVNNSNTGDTTAIACDSFTWHDTTYSTSGTPTHVYQNLAGCDSIVTLHLTINTVDVSVAVSDPAITSNANGAIYQWVDCDNAYAIIAGETSQTFTATANGDFGVIVTQGLCTDTSECVQIFSVDINSLQSGRIEVYPNPFSNELIIEIEGRSENSKYEILNSIGQVVSIGGLTKRTIVQTNRFAPGVYLIKIDYGKYFEFRKIIKE